jgi:cytochrome P450
MLAEKDFYTDPDILVDPYAFFEEIRGHGPVYQPPGKDYMIVTGFDEAVEVFRNAQDFSSVIALQGAAAPLPFVPQGSNIESQLEANRSQILGHDLLVDLDGNAHFNLRSLVNRLFTPSRLKANEEFIADYSDQLVRDAVARGGCELISEIATPFVTMVIADLLGVPVADRQLFMDCIAAAPVPGSLNEEENDYSGENHPMVVMGGYFARYIMERQQQPQDDILSELAHASYPDGTKPKLEDLVGLSTFMFGAGQDTSATSSTIRGCRKGCAPIRRASRACWKKSCAWKARPRRPRGWRCATPESATSRCRRGPRSWSPSPPSAAIRGAGTIPTASSWTARASRSTSRSGAERTPAPARHSRGWKCAC